MLAGIASSEITAINVIDVQIWVRMFPPFRSAQGFKGANRAAVRCPGFRKHNELDDARMDVRGPRSPTLDVCGPRSSSTICLFRSRSENVHDLSPGRLCCGHRPFEV